MRILLRLFAAHLWQRNIYILVLLPEVLGDGVRVVRMSKRDCEGKWSLSCLGLPDVIIQILC